MSPVPDNPFAMCQCGHAAMDHGPDGKCWVEIDDGDPHGCSCSDFEEAPKFE